jgi:3-oxoacyl-[acyl-carrier protein] reductase
MTKVALITGGVRGIGRGVALDLAGRGWSVAICYRTSTREADETVAAITTHGVKGLAVQADVSQPQAAAGLIQRVHAEWGRIDALVNGAGPYHRVQLLQETNAGWHSMFDNNLHPVFYLTQAVIPIMKQQRWGRIVSFTMANAEKLVAQPNLTAHYISKVSILALARSFAKVVAADGITINCIAPGYIDSGSAPQDELERALKTIPAGYIGSIDDAVAVTRFLLSDEARYINGANIELSGGWGI